MSGHSKWAQIKRKKAVTDAKKGAAFSKIAKEITVAAKLGGGDPSGNYRLRFAIEKAKASSMPQSNIQRAIDKGTGTGDASSNIEEIMYEGYGPGGVAILISCTTDNKNRTVKDIRSYFNKYNGKLAESGAVSFLFKRQGEIKLLKSNFKSQDEIIEFGADIEAEDVDLSDNEYVVIITKPEELEKVQKNILSKNIKPQETKITYSTKDTIEITDQEIAKNIVKLFNSIDDHDDVQEVFSNFDIKEDILTAIEN